MDKTALLASLLRGDNVGMSNPVQPLQSSAPSSGSWFDPANLTSEQQRMGGEATRGLSGLEFRPWDESGTQSFFDPNGTSSGYVISSNGTPLPVTTGPDGSLTFQDTFQDPTMSNRGDKMDVSYTLDPKTGMAIPTDSVHRYQQGSWTGGMRDFAKYAALAATAGYGAQAAFGGAGLGGETLSGMDLAADAVAGGGNNIATAGSALGQTYAPATNAALIESAVNSPGYGASSAGAGANAMADIGGASAFDQLLSKGKDFLIDKATDPNTWQSILDGATGGGTGGSSLSASGGGWQAPNSQRAQLEALRKQRNAQQQNFTPTWSGAR